jgi:predicted Zn finger-like uncharacterized protein
MYTQCPKCSTVFRIAEEQIARHKGLVRCGSCRETFNAAWNEVKNLSEMRKPASPSPQRAPSPVPEAGRTEPEPLWKPLPPLKPPDEALKAPAAPEAIRGAAPRPAAVEPDAEPKLVFPPVTATPASEAPADAAYRQLRLPESLNPLPPTEPPAAAAAEDEPDTVEEIVLESRDNFWDRADHAPAAGQPPAAPANRAARPAESAREPAAAPARRRRALAWSLAAFVLLVLAVWQIGFFYFEALAQSPLARPALEAVCAVFRCQVPPRRQLSRIDVSGAAVAYHDEIPGALKISVNLVNRAQFPQEEPTVQVTLTDKESKVVGRRAYKPDEYRRERAALAPNVVTLVTLELAAPPENAVGYEIELFDSG